MSEHLRCHDGQPDMLIPRMYFVFNEPSQSFRYLMPTEDIAASQPLKRAPRGLQTSSCPKSMKESLAACNIKNAIGHICISEQTEMTVADISIGQLPRYDAVDPAIEDYQERRVAKSQTRLPLLIARRELFKTLTDLSETQYKFGISSNKYNTSYPEAPARFSLTHDYNHFEPITVVTASFERALGQCSRDMREANRLTEIAQRYVQHHDPEVSKVSTGFVQIAQYGIFSDGLDFDYGQRGTTIDSTEYDSTPYNYRLQSPDIYVASAHNSGIVYEAIFAMLAVGMINRKALDDVAPELIR